MKRLCLINAVGLTPALAKGRKFLEQFGTVQPLRSCVPAVTMSSQATMLTGCDPRDHGIVGNGWLFKDTMEIRFWQQAHTLIQRPCFYEKYETAKLFWWFNQGAPVKWSVTPKPHYGCDGSKVFDVLDMTDLNLTDRLGAFPFHTFWGPMAGLPSSDWIARAAATVIKEHAPQLTMVYLPHLDYDYQRNPPGSLKTLGELESCIEIVAKAARSKNMEIVIVSEYGLTQVNQPIMINRHLNQLGWLKTRKGPFGEILLPTDSLALAVCDHQLAHIYVKDLDPLVVKRELELIDGIEALLPPGDLGLDHARSGDWIALAKPNAWFCYPYWLEDVNRPDFANTIDIHRKPGYDPCELFMTSKFRAMARLMQKKAGFRTRFDIVDTNPNLVQGSHGLLQTGEEGAVIIGPNPPSDMKDMPTYVDELLN